MLFVDDPGGTDIVAEKNGVILDGNATDFEDYRRVVEMVLEDGIISPSEDQLLWSLRQELGIDDAYRIQMVMSIYGDKTLKVC